MALCESQGMSIFLFETHFSINEDYTCTFKILKVLIPFLEMRSVVIYHHQSSLGQIVIPGTILPYTCLTLPSGRSGCHRVCVNREDVDDLFFC